MPESPTISNAPLEYPGLDYALLRQQGIQQLERLTGYHWTDYNAHDPGITILETLCYAITDLSYRLSFEMKDLLANPGGQSASQRSMFTAREILTVNPLTILDYRKLLIDIEGVKNAWLEPLTRPQPELFYDASQAKLTFTTPDITEPVNLRGLYRVLIEKEPAYPDAQLIEAARVRLNQHRNLCEDFAEITVLPIEEITVRAEIEVAEGNNPHELMAQIYIALDRAISPSLQFFSLKERLDQGKSAEEIFEGPPLDHGFIDDDQLQQFCRKTEIHTSDLIHVILDIAGVKTVRTMTIASHRSPTPEAWALDLDTNLTPRLKEIQRAIADFTFYKGQMVYPLECDRVEQVLSQLSPPHSSISTNRDVQDLPIPIGEYRDLAEYESIQNDFPLTYGIGTVGLPPSASEERKAQAKQLQAYLMIFDQLLANYFAQLDHMKDLFSSHNASIQTYFSQSIAHFPGGNQLLGEPYTRRLAILQEDVATALERKNRLLDHLIAQHGERFTDYSLLFPTTMLSETVIQQKVGFATDYLRISAGRNQAFDYTVDPNQPGNADNVSGLKRRIARLLGIFPDQQFLASSDQEGFYLVEHLLLRPRSSTLPDGISPNTTAAFLSFSHSILEFKAADRVGQVTCTSPQHGLQNGDRINIFFSSAYSGTYTVTNVQPDTFDIPHGFVASDTSDTGEWVSSDQSPDPFSFQMSVVFPNWPDRFQTPNFKHLINDTLIAETPAHITIYCHWLDKAAMREFETTYAIWLQSLASPGTVESREAASRLINFLELGSSEIPALPALIGYMTIGDNFVVA